MAEGRSPARVGTTLRGAFAMDATLSGAPNLAGDAHAEERAVRVNAGG